MPDALRNIIRDYPDLMLVVLIWLIIIILWVLHSKRRLQEKVDTRRAKEEKRSSQNRLSALDTMASELNVMDPVNEPNSGPIHVSPSPGSFGQPEPQPYVAEPQPALSNPAMAPQVPATSSEALPEIDMGRVSQEKRLTEEQQALLTQYTSGDGGGVEEMESMLEKDPHNLQLLDWLAFMYYSNNNADKAISTYVRILEIDPNNASQHYYLANSYYKKGDCGRAIAHWQKVVELRPDSKYAKKAIDRINKVQGA